MRIGRGLCWLAVLALTTFPVAAAAPDRIIPLRGSAHRLAIPANSPIKFRHFGKEADAHFSGRFVLTGTANYGCRIECQPPLKDEDLVMAIVPDRPIAARLPHWDQGGDMEIFISHERRLVAAIASSRELKEVRSGKISEIKKRVSVVVDNFVASIECDAPAYSARFVAMAKTSDDKKMVDGSFGCG